MASISFLKRNSGFEEALLLTPRCACADCRYMKLNTLQKLHDCLRDLTPQVEMDEDLRKRAEKPILRMLELSR